jgi:hypothetical protein
LTIDSSSFDGFSQDPLLVGQKDQNDLLLNPPQRNDGKHDDDDIGGKQKGDKMGDNDVDFGFFRE